MVQSLAVLGTGSDVGKTVITAGICRILSNHGIRVAPFKAQNMSNNAEPAIISLPPSSQLAALSSSNIGDSKVDGGNGSGMKKSKSLKVLDPKAAQNLSILLAGPVKHISYEELRKCILRCDHTVLTEDLLQGLIQYIPAPDQLNRLKEYEQQYYDLSEAEQFSISISGIKRLVPRLKSLMFKQRYSQLVQDCKPHIVAATAACEEVKKSKKFAKILELILLIGNIMNTGSKNAQSLGFDISYLPKVFNLSNRIYH